MCQEPFGKTYVQLIENGGSSRKEQTRALHRASGGWTLLLSAGTIPPSSLECAVGGTRCSGRIQRDAICEGNLFLESKASRLWSLPPPAAVGDFREGGQG